MKQLGIQLDMVIETNKTADEVNREFLEWVESKGYKTGGNMYPVDENGERLDGKTHTVSFRGIPSGDGESFAFAVDKETFIRIEGEKPTKFDKAPYNKGMYLIYPNTIFSKESRENNKPKSVEVIIEIGN